MASYINSKAKTLEIKANDIADNATFFIQGPAYIAGWFFRLTRFKEQ